MRDHATLKVDGPVHERWKLGYLIDVIYLRDIWMHRVDACRATGRDLELTPEDDGRIVADVVAEWARRHQQPFILELTGVAGGLYAAKNATSGDTSSWLALDAVEFCRTLAGRSPASGLLETIVPFLATRPEEHRSPAQKGAARDVPVKKGQNKYTERHVDRAVRHARSTATGALTWAELRLIYNTNLVTYVF